ncbi:flagellar basal body rod protein FlgB [Holophaga foetida]|uniref:flagellar basal body rod protein FlgB n=1 Tax=Holophaga foetida TaxID=35839 RepID=UPI000247464A|nr:flagellar basal body protein [Holophaga foetida]
MSEGIEAITTAALGLAMDAASLRQQAIAANIANANTVGYVPMTVDFESQMEDARLSLQSQGHLDATALAGVRPRMRTQTELGLPGKVMLDMEVARMAENSVQYQALAKGLSRHFAILSAAVSDGKK